jgi:hypothetical protein
VVPVVRELSPTEKPCVVELAVTVWDPGLYWVELGEVSVGSVPYWK